ncbi:MAG: tetratricopeptide repeat protein [Magnetococcales bacterium]|nr:glycosyltransferase family protein [Magnetococcales bacterium]NGZ25663.1 tetratricopeptide repeat protein [Magnetococcales bacterium]
METAPTRQRLALAAQLRNSGELRQAEALYQAMVNEFPQYAPTLYHLGMIKRQLGDLQQALHLLQRAVECNPDDPAVHGGLALIRKEQGDVREASIHFQKLLDLGHGSVELLCLLGDCHIDMGEADKAIPHFQQATALNPAMEESWINLGLCLNGLGKLQEAIDCYRQGLQHHPESVPLHINLAIALLSAGQYNAGWQEYHWRLKLPEVVQFMARVVGDIRLWQGESLEDAHILVVSDQGYGDALNFVRYLPELKALGAQVTFHCPTSLAPLMREAPGVDQVTSNSDLEHFPFDFFIPLSSLPRLLSIHGGNVGGRVPYLFADPGQISHWSPLFEGTRLRVGITWRGQPLHPNDPFRRRSLPPQLLTSLLKVTGVTFFLLQPGDEPPPELAGLMNLGPFLKNFADTAALVAQLDLIISIDTAMAHLAGALGKPVWTMLPMAPDWRWGRSQKTTPWYPNMTLFRQTTPGDWQQVMQEISTALDQWANQQRTTSP